MCVDRNRLNVSMLTLVNKQKEHFGQRLRHARQAARLSQQAIADVAEVSRAAVAQWEGGLRTDLMSRPATLICTFLGIRIAWLILGEGPMREELRQDIDIMTMTQIVISTEQVLALEGFQLTPEARARVYATLYANYVRSNQIPDSDAIRELVALAIL